VSSRDPHDQPVHPPASSHDEPKSVAELLDRAPAEAASAATAAAEASRLRLGHLEYADLDGHLGQGIDVLVSIYTNNGVEHWELAVRPGGDQRQITWSPPATLHPEPVEP
jgi:hypothetical protein